MATQTQRAVQAARNALESAAQTARSSYDPYVWFDVDTHQLVDPIDALSHPDERVVEDRLSTWLASLPASAEG